MNRKVKSIVNAAVAMGFGEASDYHGNSIAEVLGEVAAIAAQGGSSGGSSIDPVVVNVILTSDREGTWSGATWEEIVNAYNHSVVYLSFQDDESPNSDEVHKVLATTYYSFSEEKSICAMNPVTDCDYFLLQGGGVAVRKIQAI